MLERQKKEEEKRQKEQREIQRIDNLLVFSLTHHFSRILAEEKVSVLSNEGRSYIWNSLKSLTSAIDEYLPVPPLSENRRACQSELLSEYISDFVKRRVQVSLENIASDLAYQFLERKRNYLLEKLSNDYNWTGDQMLYKERGECLYDKFFKNDIANEMRQAVENLYSRKLLTVSN